MNIAHIAFEGIKCGILVKAGINPDNAPEATTFVTTPELNLQVGYIAYKAGGAIAAHRHKQIKRTVTGTGEVTIIIKGVCLTDFYDPQDQFIGSVPMHAGDVLIMARGIGHGYRVCADAIFLEIKQGPYFGIDEKEML